MEESFADPRNPTTMTPQQRRQEIAAILARGVLRLRHAVQASPTSGGGGGGSRSSRTSENSSKQRRIGLDEGAETSPHVLAG